MLFEGTVFLGAGFAGMMRQEHLMDKTEDVRGVCSHVDVFSVRVESAPKAQRIFHLIRRRSKYPRQTLQKERWLNEEAAWDGHSGAAPDGKQSCRSSVYQGRTNNMNIKIVGPEFPRTFLTLPPGCPEGQ